MSPAHGAVRPLLASDPTMLGRWTLQGRLGSGGMGTVFLGFDGQQLAAVKIIAPQFAEDHEFRARFRREVALGSRVEGPNIAQLLEADVDADTPWLATEYIQGPTLAEAIQQAGPLSPQALQGFAIATLGALADLHKAGVIHRDLKPTNVILTHATPVIIDFGIARAVDGTALTATMQAIGSPGWMAPEVLSDGGVGPKADVFSWAALVAFAGTGRLPFGEGPHQALAYRVVHHMPDLGGLSGSIAAAVSAGLTKDPAARPDPETLLRQLSGSTDRSLIASTVAATWPSETAVHTNSEAGTPTAAYPAPTALAGPDRDLPDPQRSPSYPRKRRPPRLGAAIAITVALGAIVALGVVAALSGDDGDDKTDGDSSAQNLAVDRAALADPDLWGLDCSDGPNRVDTTSMLVGDVLGDEADDVIAGGSCAVGSSEGRPSPGMLALFDGHTRARTLLVDMKTLGFGPEEAPQFTSVSPSGDHIVARGTYFIGRECASCALGRFEATFDLTEGLRSAVSAERWVKGLRGAAGYRQVKLGMTAKVLRLLDQVVLAPSQVPSTRLTNCKAYVLEWGGIAYVTASEPRTVSVISFLGSMKTPEGVGIGSTESQVRKSYPSLAPGPSGLPTAQISPDAAYIFQISNGFVTHLYLASSALGCVD